MCSPETVKWTFPWLEPHSVTFGKPTGDPTVLTGGANPSYDGTEFLSSGLVFGGPTSTAHTVSFGNPGDIAKLIPPGKRGIDIAQAIPAGSNYDGTGIVNSGVLGIGWSAGTSFSLNFTKAGSYDSPS